MAVSVGSQIAEAIGTDNNPEAVLAELTSNPDAALKLKKWAQEEREQIRQANIELQRISLKREQAKLADTQSARQQNKDHWMPWALSIAVFVLFSAVNAALFYLAVPEGNRDLVVYLAGQISGFFATVVVYWLGASKGGDEQTKFMIKQTENRENNQWN